MVVLEFLFVNNPCPVFCGTIFPLLDCHLFAVTFYCFAVSVWEWDENGNNKTGTPWESPTANKTPTWV